MDKKQNQFVLPINFLSYKQKLFDNLYDDLELIDNKSKNTALYFIYVLLALVIPYSRLYFKCHTIQQAIVGGIVGLIHGYYWFKHKSDVYKFINYNITK